METTNRKKSPTKQLRKISTVENSPFSKRKLSRPRLTIPIERLIVSPKINDVKISKVGRRMKSAFNDPHAILDAWNSRPSLFYFDSMLDKLIDAKCLAAIREIHFIKKEGMLLSERELYYSWLFFQGQNNRPIPAFISLANYADFQKSWRILNDMHADLIGCTATDFVASDESDEEPDL